MATGSKKGACSSNTQPVKSNCLQHDRRDENSKRVPKYVNSNLSKNNRIIFEDDMIANRKHIAPLVEKAKKLYTEKTGQKCQKSFAPFRESVFRINEKVTDEQLLSAAHVMEKETGWKLIGLYRHMDEGHAHSRYIEGDESFELNLHAHALWSCQDIITGKAIRCDRKKLSHMQDILAKYTGMERGNKASETGIKHRDAMRQRINAEEQRIQLLENYEEHLEERTARAKHGLDYLYQQKWIMSKKIEDLYKKTKKATKIMGEDYSQVIQRLSEKIIVGVYHGWKTKDENGRPLGRWHNTTKEDIHKEFDSINIMRGNKFMDRQDEINHRHILAGSLAMHCVSMLSSAQLDEVDKMLREFANEAPETEKQALMEQKRREQEQQEEQDRDNGYHHRWF